MSEEDMKIRRKKKRAREMGWSVWSGRTKGRTKERKKERKRERKEKKGGERKRPARKCWGEGRDRKALIRREDTEVVVTVFV